MARAVSGHPTRVVFAEPVRSYTSGPNHVLVWVLQRAHFLLTGFATEAGAGRLHREDYRGDARSPAHVGSPPSRKQSPKRTTRSSLQHNPKRKQQSHERSCIGLLMRPCSFFAGWKTATRTRLPPCCGRHWSHRCTSGRRSSWRWRWGWAVH